MKKHYTYSQRARPLFSLVLLFISLLFLSKNANAQGYVAGSRIWANTGSDSTHALVADPTGNSYILVSAPNAGFPVTVPSTPAGGTHRAVLIKMSPDGTIIWSKFLPGSPTVSSYYKNIAYSNGTLFLLGRTTATDMPVTNSSVNKGGWDINYAAVDTGTGSIISSVYLGGSGKDGAGLKLVAENGFAYISYTTTSTDIPVTTATSYSGGNDRVVQKLDVNGNIIYSTYIGSLTTTEATAAAFDLSVNNGLVALAGVLDGSNAFSVTDGSTPKGGNDFAITKLNADGTISFNTIYGGTGNESGAQVVIKNGEVYIAGTSSNNTYPVTDGSSFTGSQLHHVLTKFSSTGARLYSTAVAGINTSSGIPKFIVDNNSVYMAGAGFGASNPVVNVTDGSSGGNYAIRLNAANGQIVYATMFGFVRSGLANFDMGLGVTDGNMVFSVPGLNATPTFVTDGSTKAAQGGNYINVFSPEGKRIYVTWRASGSLARGFEHMIVGDKRIFLAGSANALGTNHVAVTHPITGTLNLAEVHWMSFVLCPTLPSQNDITPLNQTVCIGGATVALTGNKVALGSNEMPLLYRGATISSQQEIIARYQWQTSTSASGPWTDIQGAGTLQDYSPPSLGETRYYRRLVYPPAGCGETPISISDVAAVVVGSNSSPAVTASVYNTCVGTPVDIEATVTGGVAPYTYSWDNGISSTTNTATVTPGSNSVYTITVTDDNGCQQKGQVVVNAYAANAGPDVSSCAGQPVRIGSIPPAGLAGVVYAWTAATGLDDAAIAQPMANPGSTTTYTVEMTIPVSGGGTCTTSDEVEVKVVAAPANTEFAGPDRAICKGGSVVLGTTPAESGFTYTWTPGNYLNAVTGSSVTFNAGPEVINPNPFTFTLTASKDGCSFTDDVSVTVLDVDAGKDFCGPRTVGAGDPLPNVTGKTFLWEVVSGTGTITGPTDAPTTTVSASVGGPTIYRLTVSYLGASCSDEVAVSDCSDIGNCVLQPIEVEAAHGCPSAEFGTVTLRATPSNLPDAEWTYSWSAVPAGGLSGTTGSSVTLTDNIERDVTVTITSKINPSFSCSQTIHVNGNGWSLPSFTAQDHTICAGETVELGEAFVAGYTYLWSDLSAPDRTSSNPSASPTTSSNYIVSVTDNTNGCILKDTATIIVRNVVADPGPDWLTCSAAMVQLGTPAIPGYTYSWTPAVASYQDGTDNTSAQPKLLVATTQDFTVRVTDTETGCYMDSIVHIVVDDAPTLPAMVSPTICRGQSVQIGMPALPNVSYLWSPATGLSDPTVAQPLANPTSTETYTLVVTYYDLNNTAVCSKTGTVTVTVNGPEITMSDDSVCPSGSAYTLGTGVSATGDGPLTYLWVPTTRVAVSTDLNTAVIANPTFPTVYTLTVRDANGCSATASKTLSPLIAAPNPGSSATICVGSSITLGDAGNTGDIEWTVTPAITGSISDINSPVPVFTPGPDDAGKVFTFTCSATIGGCTNLSTATINVKALTLPEIPVQTVCENASATIGVPAVSDVSYSWYPTTGLSNPNAASTTISNITGTVAYTLTAISGDGCVATAQAVVGVNPGLAPAISIADVVTNIGVPAQAFDPQINPAIGNYTYTWTPSNKIDNPYIAGARPTENKIGNTQYTLTVTDDNGCTSTATAMLRVQAIDILPVTISGLTATAKNCGVTVNWKVETAENFSHFVVERQIAGGNWVPVRKIYYEYNRANYQYQDAEPGNGRWIYRLKLVDIDGQFTYSKQVAAEVKCNQQSSLKVYPNPANSYVYINSSKPVKTVRLFSLAGKLLFTKEINQSSAGAVQIPLTNLIRGVYILQVVAKDGTMQPSRLVKE